MSGRSPIDGDAVMPDSGRDGVMMLYDWFKHMTTLSLITLGGMIGILQGENADVRPAMLALMLIAVALAGIAGFDGMHRLLVAELEGKKIPRVLVWSRKLAMASYGMGVGAFLSLIVETVA